MTPELERPCAGGEFELHAADLALSTSGSARLPGFGAAYEVWLDCGRSALGVAARDLLRRGAHPVAWLPAYSCHSMLLPFRQAGYDVRWYCVGDRLDRVDAEPRPGDVFLFVHYFGRPHRAAMRLAESLRGRGVWVVEDCVQAGITPGVGRVGDYAVSSLRKLLPQPDGALLASRHAVPCELAEPDEAFVSARVAGKLLRGAGGDAATFLRLFEWSESRLDPAVARRMSWLSRQLLSVTDLDGVAALRRANARLLRERISATPRLQGVEFLSDTQDDAEVPLGLPIRLAPSRRDDVRRHLADNGIYCAVHWDLAHLPAGGFETERRLSGSVLTLPVDQRLASSHMERIVDALTRFPGDLT
jgi:dTDP-4-amino-4,6-dideoxygalactose transaminase